MSYTKAIVTIDLEEYNELLQANKRTDNDEIIMLKEVIIAFVKSGVGISPMMGAELKRKGVLFAVQQSAFDVNILPGHIKVKRDEGK